jgi:uncharacterized membrane protein YdjX (TVP38/TMEM64 family)
MGRLYESAVPDNFSAISAYTGETPTRKSTTSRTTELMNPISETSDETPRRSRSASTRRVVAIVAAVIAFVLLGRWAGRFVPQVAQSIADLGPLGPLAFIVAYAAGVIAFVPGSILTLAAGAIFGLVEGTIYVFVAATLGAWGAFLVSRYVARSHIQQRLASDKRFDAIDRAVADQGRKIVFLLRLSPVFPFSVLNYVLGLTRVRMIDYLVACVGMLPGTILYVYYGKLAGDVAAAIGGAAPERGAEYYAVLVAGLVATLIVTAVVAKAARRALREASDV